MLRNSSYLHCPINFLYFYLIVHDDRKHNMCSFHKHISSSVSNWFIVVMCNRYSWYWFLYLSRFVCYINCLSYCLLRCLLNYYFLDACCTGCFTTFLAWLAFLTGVLTALVCFTLFWGTSEITSPGKIKGVTPGLYEYNWFNVKWCSNAILYNESPATTV